VQIDRAWIVADSIPDALRIVAERCEALENALRLVLMKSTDFDGSFCNLCHTKDRHADDCVSKIANEALALSGASR
jgi:uncharacterized protein Yka (UPF0111/DUF47 family)